MQTLWKPVIGFEGIYEINNQGIIRSIDRFVANKNGERLAKGKTISHIKSNSGYMVVNLKNNGKSKQFLVHRLIALHFIDNPMNLPEINHKDGNKCNNDFSNLEWCSKSENIAHSYKLGLSKSNFKQTEMGEKNPNNKLAEDDVKLIRDEYSKGWKSQRQLAKEFNVSQQCIGNIINRKTWKHI